MIEMTFMEVGVISGIGIDFSNSAQMAVLGRNVDLEAMQKCQEQIREL